MSSRYEPERRQLGHSVAHVHTAKDVTDPTFVGPGYWVMWHYETVDMTSEDEQRAWIPRFRAAIKKFPCTTCRTHAEKYLELNPPEGFVGVKYLNLNLGMFVYLNTFHNSVNARTGKPAMSIEQAYNTYSNTTACGSTCAALAQQEESSGSSLLRPLSLWPEPLPSL